MDRAKNSARGQSKEYSKEQSKGTDQKDRKKKEEEKRKEKKGQSKGRTKCRQRFTPSGKRVFDTKAVRLLLSVETRLIGFRVPPSIHCSIVHYFS